MKTVSVARRRFLQGVATVAVIGFDPVRRTWLTEARAGRALSRIPRLDGELVTDAASLAAAADDFGHFVHRTPRAVLRPGSVDDVVAMVRYAKQHRLDIAARGQGHSTHGQSQVEAGIVIDTSTLASVQVNASDAVVGPGARWREIVGATLPRGLTPPTLPNFLDLTVGGNIAVGGIGGASHRHGAIVDNVLELEVVTGTGNLRRCSATREPTLFNAVLGGLGQFGIVVRARIKLVPARQLARIYTLQYPDVSSLLDDARILALNERFDHLEGQVNPDPTGQYGPATLFAVKFFDPPAPPNDAALLGGLAPASSTTTDLPYMAFLGRIDPLVEMAKAVGAWSLPHPFFDVFLPESTVELFLEEIVSTLTIDDTGNGPVVIYPLRRSKLCRPFLRVPERDEVLFLFDILGYAPPVPEVVAQQIARNTGWFRRARQLGGKAYHIGSLDLTHDDWKAHFSPIWPAAVLAKLAYDPTNILTPGQGIFPSGRCDD